MKEQTTPRNVAPFYEGWSLSKGRRRQPVASVRVDGRAVLLRRRARGSGGRRSLRHRDRSAHALRPLRFTVHKDIAIKALQFVYPGEVRAYESQRDYHVTCGVAPDLMEASKNAVRHMIEHLGKTDRLSPEEAYVLCSVAVDLHISQVVDTPNWIVWAFLPLDLFTLGRGGDEAWGGPRPRSQLTGTP